MDRTELILRDKALVASIVFSVAIVTYPFSQIPLALLVIIGVVWLYYALQVL